MHFLFCTRRHRRCVVVEEDLSNTTQPFELGHFLHFVSLAVFIFRCGNLAARLLILTDFPTTSLSSEGLIQSCKSLSVANAGSRTHGCADVSKGCRSKFKEVPSARRDHLASI